MKRSWTLSCVVLAASLAALASGCAHHHYRHEGPPGPVVVEPGPPPHAPAHGHRHKHRHQDAELVFDARLGVYVVVGWPDVYFHHDHFYRLVDGAWQISVRLDEGWRSVDHARLPKGLAKKKLRAKGHGKKGHGKGRHRGPHPAKHRRH